MTDDAIPSGEPDVFRSTHEFWDIYIITQGGSIRRTALPRILWANAIWAMDPDLEPGFIDRAVCTQAEFSGCGYAEAFMLVVERGVQAMQDEFLLHLNDKPNWEKTRDAFIKEQERRERLWREANNEWRKELPPPID